MKKEEKNPICNRADEEKQPIWIMRRDWDGVGGGREGGGGELGREEYVKITQEAAGRLAIWTSELTAWHVPSAANVEKLHYTEPPTPRPLSPPAPLLRYTTHYIRSVIRGPVGHGSECHREQNGRTVEINVLLSKLMRLTLMWQPRHRRSVGDGSDFKVCGWKTAVWAY